MPCQVEPNWQLGTENQELDFNTSNPPQTVQPGLRLLQLRCIQYGVTIHAARLADRAFPNLHSRRAA